MATDDLNIFQQVYLQTFAANMAGLGVGTEGMLQFALNKLVNTLMTTTLKPYGWEVTWGPRVWKNSPSNPLTGLDNAWFAAECKNVTFPDGVTADACVVAISGTAIFSTHDWPVENFGVDQVVQFTDWSSSWTADSIKAPEASGKSPTQGAYTAYGTSEGVFQVLSNTSPDGNPSAGRNIMQYLATLPDSTRVIVTGHSLGGALAPTVAYGLTNSKQLKGNGLILAAAGATPGNNDTAKGYNTTFPAKGTEGYQIWNTDYYNKYDIVSQAWCTEPDVSPARHLQNIITIYGTLDESLNKTVTDLVQKEVDSADSSGIVYYPIQGTEFEGTAPSSPPSTFPGFMLEATKQHTKAYYDQIKIGSTMAGLYRQFVKSEGVGKLNLQQAAERLPVLRFSKPKHLGDGFQEIYPYDVILESE